MPTTTATKAGYTFGGWNANAAGTGTNYTVGQKYTSFTASTTVYAKWTANTYTVTYDGNGATGGSTASSTHTYGVEKALTANGYTREYTVTYNYNGSGAANTQDKATYTFKNWNTNAGGTGTKYTDKQVVENLTSTSNGTVKLFAQWNSDSVTLPTPTRSGYGFAGWYDAATGGNKVADGGAVYTPTENKTLYAHWTTNSYTVTYNYAENGGTEASKTSASVSYGEAIDLAPTATKAGYEFVGWNTNKDATEGLSSLTMGTNDVTLYAIYKKEITLTFIDYNGTEKTTRTESNTAYNKNTSVEITAPTINAYTGWTERYWTTGTGATSSQTVASGGSITATGNSTYYARYYQSISVKFDLNGGTGVAPQAVTGNRETNSYAISTVTNPEITMPTTTATKTGYTFGGWNANAAGTGANYTVGQKYTSFTASTIVYAKWTDTIAPTITTYAGAMLYTDPSFASGTNSIRVYNNSGNGTVTHTRKAMSDNPEGSGYGIEIKTTGTASPGYGGFYFGTQTAANKEFITRIVAKIPVGYNIEWASNAGGDGRTNQWLTSTAGTGKWEEYAVRVKCGSTGTFGTTNYYYLKGGSTATSSAPVVWQVGYATVIDTTKWSTTNYIISVGKDEGTGVVGYGLNQSSTTQPTYTSNAANKNVVKISNALTANGTYYTWMKDQAGNYTNKATTVKYIDRTPPTVTLGTNGGTYTITPENSTASISTKITAADTGGSGLSTRKYQLSTATSVPSTSDSNWKTFTSGGTITESKSGGTYYLYTYVTDAAGNRATSIQKSNPYTVNYQVVYNANGGSGAPGAQTKTHGVNLTLSTTKPTRTGYTF